MTAEAALLFLLVDQSHKTIITIQELEQVLDQTATHLPGLIVTIATPPLDQALLVELTEGQQILDQTQQAELTVVHLILDQVQPAEATAAHLILDQGLTQEALALDHQTEEAAVDNQYLFESKIYSRTK